MELHSANTVGSVASANRWYQLEKPDLSSILWVMKYQRARRYCHAQLSRRRFIKNAAIITSSWCLSPFIHSQTSQQQEAIKRKAAKHIMVFASPYDWEQKQFTPHMHQEFKQNVEQFSSGEIYVDIHDKGALGIGTELSSLVARGKAHAGLISVANLSPILPILDILNIPFWSADNQSYLNLITSKIWKDRILSPIKQQGKLEILYHHITGPRTITSTRHHNGRLSTPKSLKNIALRVPASDVLKHFYRMCNVNPIEVKWKSVARAARTGRIKALDPSIVGMFNGPGDLRSLLATICEIQSVQDGWLSVINQQWLNSLPYHLKIAIEDAATKTFNQHITTLPRIEQLCREELIHAGVQLYQPNAEEIQQWHELAGHNHPSWTPIKQKLLGDTRTFDQFLAATKINNGKVLS